MSENAIALRLGGQKVIGRRIETDAELIDAVREGLPAESLDSVFEYLQEEQIPQSVVYRVIGSGRTLQRKRSSGSTLSPMESDRLARLARILVRAEEAFTSGAMSRRWMAQPNRALGGARPIDLLDSDTGTLSVERLLGRIEHGVYS